MAVTRETTLPPAPAMASPAFEGDSPEPDAPRGDERALLERLRAGDASAFDELVASHHATVRRLAYRLLGWSGDAEDVVQEVFLVALERCGKFEGRSSLSTWLTAITLNKCRTHRRRRLLRLKGLWDWWERRGGDAGKEVARAEEAAEQDERRAAVRRAVQALPPSDREVVVLHYLEQVGVEEMAGLLGLSRNATEVRLHRARRRLKERLGGLVEE